MWWVMGKFQNIELEIAPGSYLVWALGILLLPLPLFFGVLAAIAVHELAHLVALWAFRVRILSFCAMATGIRIHTEPMEASQELLCAAAGPIASFLLISLSGLWPQLAVCAFIQGFINLLPLGHSDGARILRCVLTLTMPDRAERLSKGCDILFRLICIGIGVWFMIRFPKATVLVLFALAMVLGRTQENPLAKMAFRGYNRHNYVLRGNKYDRFTAQNSAGGAKACTVHRRRIQRN